ncbi:MAG: polysaccharide deacetylase [Syntrophobacteraceae bacterium]|nr:polysaccharide deacetylase [Syntrophobacteraceae bacterium]
MRNGSSVSTRFGVPADYRPRQFSPLWQTSAKGWREQLAGALDRACGSSPATIFFRADDIGAGGRAFEALCRLFRHHDMPLGMAVVPAWLSDVRRTRLFAAAPVDESLWSWHQHGWRHVNWQRSGKKSEFGEQRPFEKQWRDIWQGRQKMEDLFGSHLVSVFTPPWNRLSNSTLRILHNLKFDGVSLAGPFPRGIKPPLPLVNLKIHVDLHTRKNRDAESDFNNLLEELSSLPGKKEPAGIMIHHQRMTHFAFEFLDELLCLFGDRNRARVMNFREILDKGANE